MKESVDLPLGTILRLVRALDSASAPYAIIGGVAVAIRSVPRFTNDVDAVLWVGEDAWEAFLRNLEHHGFTTRATNPIEFAKLHRLLLLTDEDGVQVDLSLGALPFEQEMIRNAEPIEIAPGLIASIATPECLVVMKAVAWRTKDIQDIREIVSINDELDREYIIEQFSMYAEILGVPERVAELEMLLDDKM
jgi:predicted nucleotidyltransferase